MKFSILPTTLSTVAAAVALVVVQTYPKNMILVEHDQNIICGNLLSTLFRKLKVKFDPTL